MSSDVSGCAAKQAEQTTRCHLIAQVQCLILRPEHVTHKMKQNTTNDSALAQAPTQALPIPEWFEV